MARKPDDEWTRYTEELTSYRRHLVRVLKQISDEGSIHLEVLATWSNECIVRGLMSQGVVSGPLAKASHEQLFQVMTHLKGIHDVLGIEWTQDEGPGLV